MHDFRRRLRLAYGGDEEPAVFVAVLLTVFAVQKLSDTVANPTIAIFPSFSLMPLTMLAMAYGTWKGRRWWHALILPYVFFYAIDFTLFHGVAGAEVTWVRGVFGLCVLGLGAFEVWSFLTVGVRRERVILLLEEPRRLDPERAPARALEILERGVHPYERRDLVLDSAAPRPDEVLAQHGPYRLAIRAVERSDLASESAAVRRAVEESRDPRVHALLPWSGAVLTVDLVDGPPPESATDFIQDSSRIREVAAGFVEEDTVAILLLGPMASAVYLDPVLRPRIADQDDGGSVYFGGVHDLSDAQGSEDMVVAISRAQQGLPSFEAELRAGAPGRRWILAVVSREGMRETLWLEVDRPPEEGAWTGRAICAGEEITVAPGEQVEVGVKSVLDWFVADGTHFRGGETLSLAAEREANDRTGEGEDDYDDIGGRDSLRELAEAPREELLAVVRDEQGVRCATAMKMLAEQEGATPELVEALRMRLSGQGNVLRYGAAKTLAAFGNGAAAAEHDLRELLVGECGRAAYWAARALEGIHGRALVELAGDSSQDAERLRAAHERLDLGNILKRICKIEGVPVEFGRASEEVWQLVAGRQLHESARRYLEEFVPRREYFSRHMYPYTSEQIVEESVDEDYPAADHLNIGSDSGGNVWLLGLHDGRPRHFELGVLYREGRPDAEFRAAIEAESRSWDSLEELWLMIEDWNRGLTPFEEDGIWP